MNIIQYLADHAMGFVVAFLILYGIIGLFQYVCWIFRWGRFSQDASMTGPSGRTQESTIRHMGVKFIVEIINDFRHLLALVIVIIFAITLLAVCQAGYKLNDFDGVKEGIQLVTSSLGGLVGSIIGYYFGESAAKKDAGSTPNQGPPILKQGEPPDAGAAQSPATPPNGIKPAPPPPDLSN